MQDIDLTGREFDPYDNPDEIYIPPKKILQAVGPTWSLNAVGRSVNIADIGPTITNYDINFTRYFRFGEFNFQIKPEQVFHDGSQTMDYFPKVPFEGRALDLYGREYHYGWLVDIPHVFISCGDKNNRMFVGMLPLFDSPNLPVFRMRNDMLMVDGFHVSSSQDQSQDKISVSFREGFGSQSQFYNDLPLREFINLKDHIVKFNPHIFLRKLPGNLGKDGATFPEDALGITLAIAKYSLLRSNLSAADLFRRDDSGQHGEINFIRIEAVKSHVLVDIDIRDSVRLWGWQVIQANMRRGQEGAYDLGEFLKSMIPVYEHIATNEEEMKISKLEEEAKN